MLRSRSVHLLFVFLLNSASFSLCASALRPSPKFCFVLVVSIYSSSFSEILLRSHCVHLLFVFLLNSASFSSVLRPSHEFCFVLIVSISVCSLSLSLSCVHLSLLLFLLNSASFSLCPSQSPATPHPTPPPRTPKPHPTPPHLAEVASELEYKKECPLQTRN